MDGPLISVIIFLALASGVAAIGMFARDVLAMFRPASGTSQTLPAGSIRLRRIQRTAVQSAPNGPVARFDQWFTQLIRETGWSWTPFTGVLLLSLGGLVVGGGLFLATENTAAAGLGGLLGMALALGGLGVIRMRRLRLMQKQLPGVLDVLARSLRAGNSLDEAIEVVGEEAPRPIADEFRYCSRQLALGLGLPAAMRSLTDRLRLVDVKLLAMSLSIHRDTGGNVALVLERLASMIRDRSSYHRQLRAVTSAGRFSALLVGAIGPILFLYLFTFQTHYIRVMLESPLGQVLLLTAAVLEVIGLAWTARLMRPVY